MMKAQFKSLIGVLVLLSASAGWATDALAQSAPSSRQRPQRSISETFDRAFFRNSAEYYFNRSIFRQVNFYVLPFTYPEREIDRDAQGINKLYREVLNQQLSSDPIIRTPDLNNPFDSSLLSLPSANASSPGTSFNSELDRLPLP